MTCPTQQGMLSRADFLRYKDAGMDSGRTHFAGDKFDKDSLSFNGTLLL